jgi:hypothetical protein
MILTDHSRRGLDIALDHLGKSHQSCLVGQARHWRVLVLVLQTSIQLTCEWEGGFP